ncbi:MAG: hypothetical protein HW421_1298 [Ignavibacteria bacterium]|nr:hypothetical protein [Ignavibacteria bacterium]
MGKGKPQQKRYDNKNTKKPVSAQGSEQHIAKEIKHTEPKKQEPKPKFEWNLKNPQVRVLIPYFIGIIIFFTIWTEPGVVVMDPWFRAVKLVDSSRRVQDPAEKSRLLETGGNQLRELIAKYPKHARVHFLLGYYYITAQKFDSAMIHEKIAIQLDSGSTINPVWLDAQNHLALCVANLNNDYLKKGQYGLALKLLSECKPYISQNFEFYNQCALVYHNLGVFDSAEVYYDRSLRINPEQEHIKKNFSNILYSKGNNDLMKNNIDEAIDSFNKAGALNPANPDIFSNLGIAYMRKNDKAKARASFEKALSINPNHPTAGINIRLLKSQN